MDTMIILILVSGGAVAAAQLELGWAGIAYGCAAAVAYMLLQICILVMIRTGARSSFVAYITGLIVSLFAAFLGVAGLAESSGVYPGNMALGIGTAAGLAFLFLMLVIITGVAFRHQKTGMAPASNG